jgi:hypothetical protein
MALLHYPALIVVDLLMCVDTLALGTPCSLPPCRSTPFDTAAMRTLCLRVLRSGGDAQPSPLCHSTRRRRMLGSLLTRVVRHGVRGSVAEGLPNSGVWCFALVWPPLVVVGSRNLGVGHRPDLGVGHRPDLVEGMPNFTLRRRGVRTPVLALVAWCFVCQRRAALAWCSSRVVDVLVPAFVAGSFVFGHQAAFTTLAQFLSHTVDSWDSRARVSTTERRRRWVRQGFAVSTLDDEWSTGLMKQRRAKTNHEGSRGSSS